MNVVGSPLWMKYLRTLGMKAYSSILTTFSQGKSSTFADLLAPS